MVNMSGPMCEGPSYPDGKCGGMVSQATKPVRPAHPNPWSTGASAESAARADTDSGPPDAFIPSLMVVGLFLAVFAKKQLLQLFGVVEDLTEQAGRVMAAPAEPAQRERRTTPSAQSYANVAPPPEAASPTAPPRPPGGGFGRKGV
jgi:hypothetical protein